MEKRPLVIDYTDGKVKELSRFDSLPQDQQIYALRELIKKLVKAQFLASDNGTVFLMSEPDLVAILNESLSQ